MPDVDPRAALRALVTTSGDESLASLSRLLGRNEAYLQQWVTRGTPRVLAEADRALLARYLGVDESVLGGRAALLTPERVRVSRLDVAAAAGPGAINDRELAVGDFGFPPRLLRALGVRDGPLALIRAQGWSMEPGIADGDELLVDEGNRHVPLKGGVFVLRVDGTTLVKRVRRERGRLVITSDHPDAPPVTGEDVEVIGRVVWLSRAVR